MQKLLSIVIANYNYGRFLESAISSVTQQDGFEDCELIIVDGGSTDNSVEIIRNHSTEITWWVSEKDSGQSEAFNKGFSHATGKYLTWLNADDILHPGALAPIIKNLKNNPRCDWFTGNFYRFTQDGAIAEIGWGPHCYPEFLQRKNSPLVIFGPTSFFSKEIYERYGRIDEKLHYIMDNDLWQRFIVAGIKQRRIPNLCWGFRMHEDSKTAEYGSHVVSRTTAEKMHAESIYSLNKTGYRASKLIYYAILLFRCLDGSLIKRFWLQLTFKKVEEK